MTTRHLAVRPMLIWGSPLVALALVACQPPAAPASNATAEAGAPSARVMIDQAKADIAIAELKKEGWVKSVRFDDRDQVSEWQISVEGKGQPEYGYAEVACMTIMEAGAVDERTEVWILDDAARRAAGGVDVIQRAKLAGLKCKTGGRLA